MPVRAWLAIAVLALISATPRPWAGAEPARADADADADADGGLGGGGPADQEQPEGIPDSDPTVVEEDEGRGPPEAWDRGGSAIGGRNADSAAARDGGPSGVRRPRFRVLCRSRC